jgi:hypothetical protein
MKREIPPLLGVAAVVAAADTINETGDFRGVRIPGEWRM